MFTAEHEYIISRFLHSRRSFNFNDFLSSDLRLVLDLSLQLLCSCRSSHAV